MNFIRLFLTASIVLVTNWAIAQDANGIKMISKYGSANAEISNILQFQNIDHYQVKFTGQNLKGKYFTLIAKEMWDGKVKKVDTVLNSKMKQDAGKIKEDTLLLTVFGNRVDKKLKLFFKLPMVGLTRYYDAIISDDYSLRAIGTDVEISANKTFPAFVYMLPYIEDDVKDYCSIDQSGVNVEDWGKKFKIKHYVIFEMKFQE